MVLFFAVAAVVGDVVDVALDEDATIVIILTLIPHTIQPSPEQIKARKQVSYNVVDQSSPGLLTPKLISLSPARGSVVS